MSAFPLYSRDNIPSIKLNTEQIGYIDIVKEKLRTGTYKLITVKCLCNKNSTKDVIVTEKDRYGFNISSIICGNCGLIRSEKIFDEKSTNSFYTHEYRKIYQPAGISIASFFVDQSKSGNKFYQLFVKEVGHLKGANLFEIGCGAGGLMMPFYKAGYKCGGCDFNVDYLNYGRSQGLDLYNGDYRPVIEDNSQDIILLSHVLEHIADPIKELNDIFEKIKPNGYLILEVPGVYFIHKIYFDPIKYFQNAHVYNFYKKYLIEIVDKLGLKVIYGDERCTFILQKGTDWKRRESLEFNSIEGKDQAQLIKKYILRTYLQNKFRLNYYYWKTVLHRIYLSLKR
jgi:2-polyprenyl-3-methyl-5-hydroxy-6-metoxy-1,4-benzoquinol methylase